MQELKIGDKVNINALGVTGVISGEDSMGYNVEYRDKRGNVACRLFIIEELSAAEESAPEKV